MEVARTAIDLDAGAGRIRDQQIVEIDLARDVLQQDALAAAAREGRLCHVHQAADSDILDHQVVPLAAGDLPDVLQVGSPAVHEQAVSGRIGDRDVVEPGIASRVDDLNAVAARMVDRDVLDEHVTHAVAQQFPRRPRS